MPTAHKQMPEASTNGLPHGWKAYCLDTVGSTNDIAKELAVNGESEGTIVRANVQTKGRGRRARTWISPKGNLYCSTLVKVDRSIGEMGLLGFVMSVALVDAVCSLAPDVKLYCKWPNDVLGEAGKISGMILESVASPIKGHDFIVVGLGVNVTTPPDTDVLYPATSLLDAGVQTTPEQLLSAVANSFSHWLTMWRTKGFEPVRVKWLAHAKGLGQPIKVRLPATTLDGIFMALDDNGALILQENTGKTRKIVAGDVFF